MSAAFGGQTVDILRGSIPSLKTSTKVWTVPGIDGVGVRTTGASDGRFSIELIRFGSASTVKAWLTACESLQGTLVSITDDHATTTTGVFVISVQRPPGALLAEVGNGGYIGRLVVMGTVRS